MNPKQQQHHGESPRGFIGPGPSLASLQPTPAEQAKLQSLWASLKSAAGSHYILGGTVTCRACHGNNNPNNTCCWHCGKSLA